MADAIGRRVGIPGTGKAHWGEHLCAFFYSKSDLLNLVVPYIKAGLEDNEFCLWITEDNLHRSNRAPQERVTGACVVCSDKMPEHPVLLS